MHSKLTTYTFATGNNKPEKNMQTNQETTKPVAVKPRVEFIDMEYVCEASLIIKKKEVSGRLYGNYICGSPPESKHVSFIFNQQKHGIISEGDSVTGELRRYLIAGDDKFRYVLRINQKNITTALSNILLDKQTCDFKLMCGNNVLDKGDEVPAKNEFYINEQLVDLDLLIQTAMAAGEFTLQINTEVIYDGKTYINSERVYNATVNTFAKIGLFTEKELKKTAVKLLKKAAR